MTRAQYWIEWGVGPEKVREYASLAKKTCPWCEGDGLYLDVGGLPVSCGCLDGKIARPLTLDLTPRPKSPRRIREFSVTSTRVCTEA